MTKGFSLVFAVLLLATPATAQLGSHFSEAEMERLDAATSRIEGVLLRYKDLPGAKPLVEKFGGNLRVTKFVSDVPGGASTVFFARASSPPQDVASMVEIVVFGEEHLNHPRIQGKKIFYDTEWRAVFSIDVPFSEAWFDAFLMHELVHAYHHRIGSSSAHAPMLSDRWIAEELEAHDLERAVLMSATRGTYERAIRNALQTAPKTPADIPVFTDEVHAELDKVFTRAHPHERGMREAQLMYDFFSVWIETKFTPMEWFSEKKELYHSVLSYR